MSAKQETSFRRPLYSPSLIPAQTLHSSNVLMYGNVHVNVCVCVRAQKQWNPKYDDQEWPENDLTGLFHDCNSTSVLNATMI